MNSPHRSYISVFFIVVSCLILPIVTGCMQFVRHPSNHSLWHTRLPLKPDYKGVVFILQSPPKAEFAFLLAQKYPESFVVVVPSLKYDKRQDMYSYKETDTELRALFVSPGDSVFRITSWITGRDIPITSTTLVRYLEKNLVCHHMKLVSCAKLPQSLTESPCITLTWSNKNREIAIPEDKNSTPLMMYQYLTLVPSLITLGLLTPPIPTTIFGNINHPEALDINLDGNENIDFVARDKAFKGYQIGTGWVILFAPFISDYGYALGEESGGHSPGGWADCLEQMFRHPKVRQLGSATSMSTLHDREEIFRQMYETGGYDLEPKPLWNHVFGNPCYLIPRNPLLNIRLFIIFPLIEFFPQNWPSNCFLKSHQDPKTPSYLWVEYSNNKNRLAPVWEYDDQVDKAKSH